MQKIHIRLLIFTLVFVLCFSNGKAQEDLALVKSFAQFKKYTGDLQGLFFATDPGFYPGKFYFSLPENIRETYQQISDGLFPVFSEDAFRWYQLLDSLSANDKKNLVRFYSFYENEIEAALEKAGLPVSLKYLAFALSSMNPVALGTGGKAGVWQLTYFQAILNGGKISRLVDERLNVELETQMAARQLKQDLSMYTEPELAMAAFLCGHTKVKNTLYLVGGNAGVDKVIRLLPAEVHQTIAAFQALTVFLQVNRFEPLVEPFQSEGKPDTVLIYRRLHFQQVEDVIGIQVKQLHGLNPQYKFLIVPGENTPQILVLPHGKKGDFVLWQDSIYNACDSTLFQVIAQKIEYPPSPNRQYAHEPVKDLVIEGKTKIQYRLKTGDVLGIIAEKYDVRVADLKYWNNIYNERKIQAGKKLDIFVDDNKAGYYLNLVITEKPQKKATSMVEKIKKSSTLKVFENLDSAKKIEHIVKSGESPYVIAKKYDGVTPDEILEWNHIDDARKIQIGQKIIVYIK